MELWYLLTYEVFFLTHASELGNFIQSLLNFIIISIVLFFIVKGDWFRICFLNERSINSKCYTAYVAAFHKKEAVVTKACTFCTKDIPIKAVRCPHCTSQVPNETEAASDETSLLETKVEA